MPKLEYVVVPDLRAAEGRRVDAGGAAQRGGVHHAQGQPRHRQGTQLLASNKKEAYTLPSFYISIPLSE